MGVNGSQSVNNEFINKNVLKQTIHRASTTATTYKSKLSSAWSGRSVSDDTLIVSIMLPLYYTKDKMNTKDLKLLVKSWDSILMDSSPVWQNVRGQVEFKTCREWFENVFYDRLFDIHPFSKKMFSKFSITSCVLNLIF